MNRNQAFEHCLEHAIKPKETKGVWASYLHRYRKGALKEKTILKLLKENNYILVESEKWATFEQTKNGLTKAIETIKLGKQIDCNRSHIIQEETIEEDNYITLAVFDKSSLRFKLRTLKADTEKEAIQKNNGQGKAVNDMDELIKYVNNTIEENSR